jgi:hypothetical protein
MEIKEKEKLKKNLPRFFCNNCDFKCYMKCDWDRHILRPKHLSMVEGNQNELKNLKKTYFFDCECGKKFMTNSGLWKHKKVCIQNTILEKENINLEEKENSIFELTNDKLIKENNSKDDLIQYLISENKEFKNLILEFVKKDNITNNISNINTNNTNSHNKTFNLQFFLNETCKDAMNMSEFINSLTFQLSDLENVGKVGFVDGISNIIIKNLEALDVEKRPVHCCDAKRETMYIKDQDKWEKEDNDLKKMRDLVRYVRDKNISMVNTWRDMYPECVKSDSKKTTQYNKIYMEAFGGEIGGEKGTKLEKEEKIISRIAKSVIIDKNMLLEKV